MQEFFLRLIWIIVVCGMLAYGSFLVVGKMVFAQASGENEPIAVRDELAPSSHHLSGILMVPQTCDELEEHVDKLSDTEFKLVFETWQDPAVTCINESAPRAFHDQFFAPPTGVHVLATMNDQPLPVVVIPVTGK